MSSKFTSRTALAVIVANMIGTGVFTSLGYQLVTLQSGFPLIMLWIVGGVAALCGALSYAELGAALPRSGGEYNFLSRIYHPGAGFVSGWISTTIGFSAPVALAAMTFGAYISSALIPGASEVTAGWVERALAVGLIVILTAVHTIRRRTSGQFQLVFTFIKVAVILVFSVGALALVSGFQPISLFPKLGDTGDLVSNAFAVSLIYVSYAYTGWNAATYLTGELEDAQRSLPRILVLGTVIVMGLYVLLNAVFLLTTPIEKMTGQIEIGVIAAQHVFGQTGAATVGLVLGILLISTVSAMTIAGPRVLQVIGQDISTFKWLAKENEDGLPINAVIVQSMLALIFVLTSTFEQVLIFAGFTLALNSLVTVAGLFVLRLRQPELARPFKVPLFPIVPLIYLGLTGWTLFYVSRSNPLEAGVGLALIISGIIIYAVSRGMERQST